jgi:hypothetical protein
MKEHSFRSARWTLCLGIGAELLLVPATFIGRTAAFSQSPGLATRDPQPDVSQHSIIGSIDFYGLRKVTEPQVQRVLGLKEGGMAPLSDTGVSEVVRRVEAISGVVRARLELVCCNTEGRSMLFVGIEEAGAPRFRYRPVPTSAVSLPPTLVATYRRFEKAWEEAVRNGDSGDDLSQGHSLAHNPGVRAIQEQFRADAASHLSTLRRALRHSRDAEQRQMAAWILGYAANKRAVIKDLVEAARDSDEGVRNNATRALAAIAALAQKEPEQRIHIPTEQFIAMLNSLAWSDRNKAAMLLMAVTADRPAAVLKQLRRRALPSLIEMARWRSPGHALAPYLVLGRVVGVEEQEIWQSWARGERERVLERAMRAAS